MYNLLISTAIALATAGLVLLLGFPWVSAIFPALLVFPVVLFLLTRRTGKQVEAAMAPLQELMQKGKIAETEALLVQVRDTYGPWQILLKGQITGQIGMLKYMQQKYDEALPLLEQASGRDWTAQAAQGCIHFRRGDHDAAWSAFDDAVSAAGKDANAWALYVFLLVKHGDRDKALSVLARGLEKTGESELLKKLRNRVANKQRIDPSVLGDMYFQFFPEEMVKRMAMRGTRGNPLEGLPIDQIPRHMQQGPPQPKMRGKMARRR